jgi:hypothetical protein
VVDRRIVDLRTHDAVRQLLEDRRRLRSVGYLSINQVYQTLEHRQVLDAKLIRSPTQLGRRELRQLVAQLPL